MKTYEVFTFGNTKVGPDVLCFNLPAIQTCTPSEWCRKKCYALTGWFQLTNVKNSLRARLELSRIGDFVPLVTRALERTDKRYVRIHVSGDFYSPTYVYKWIEVCKLFPDKFFKATTKRTDLMEAIGELDSLPNVTIKDSVDFTRRATGRLSTIIAINESDGSKGLPLCIEDCQLCGYKCWSKTYSTQLKIIGDYYHRRRVRR